jgi:hypothetical protein
MGLCAFTEDNKKKRTMNIITFIRFIDYDFSANNIFRMLKKSMIAKVKINHNIGRYEHQEIIYLTEIEIIQPLSTIKAIPDVIKNSVHIDYQYIDRSKLFFAGFKSYTL